MSWPRLSTLPAAPAQRALPTLPTLPTPGDRSHPTTGVHRTLYRTVGTQYTPEPDPARRDPTAPRGPPDVITFPQFIAQPPSSLHTADLLSAWEGSSASRERGENRTSGGKTIDCVRPEVRAARAGDSRRSQRITGPQSHSRTSQSYYSSYSGGSRLRAPSVTPRAPSRSPSRVTFVSVDALRDEIMVARVFSKMSRVSTDGGEGSSAARDIEPMLEIPTSENFHSAEEEGEEPEDAATEANTDPDYGYVNIPMGDEADDASSQLRRNPRQVSCQEGQTPRRGPGRQHSVTESTEPSVSNTTQRLIQKQLRRSTFQFPEVSVSAQRKALGTPRVSDPSPLTTRSLAGLRRGTRHSQDVKRFPTLDRSNSDLETVADTPRTVVNKTPRATNEHDARNSQTSARSGKTNKFISLGLPRVNLDFDRNHFAHGSLRRRSQRLRDQSSKEQHDSPSRYYSDDPDKMVVNIGPDCRASVGDLPGNWPGRMVKRQLSSPQDDSVSSGSDLPSGVVHLLPGPSLASSGSTSGTPTRVPSPNPRRVPSPRHNRRPRSDKPTDTSVSYSYYQIKPPPGLNGHSADTDMTAAADTDGLTPMYRYI